MEMTGMLRDFVVEFMVGDQKHTRLMRAVSDVGVKAALILDLQRELGSTDTLKIIDVVPR